MSVSCPYTIQAIQCAYLMPQFVWLSSPQTDRPIYIVIFNLLICIYLIDSSLYNYQHLGISFAILPSDSRSKIILLKVYSLLSQSIYYSTLQRHFVKSNTAQSYYVYCIMFLFYCIVCWLYFIKYITRYNRISDFVLTLYGKTSRQTNWLPGQETPDLLYKMKFLKKYF